MSVCLLVMTDGRDDCLERTLASFDEMVSGPVTSRVIHNDSGDTEHGLYLHRRYAPQYFVINSVRRKGFAGAISAAWQFLAGAPYLIPLGSEDWIFHLEDDFIFNRPVDLVELMAFSEAHPHLAQVALRRQPWGAVEGAAGGFVEAAPPGVYVERTDGDVSWVETALGGWTTNPSLYRRDITRLGWPDAPRSEEKWGSYLRRAGLPWGVPAEDVRFGFWGSIEAGREWVHHIGATRLGTGY